MEYFIRHRSVFTQEPSVFLERVQTNPHLMLLAPTGSASLGKQEPSCRLPAECWAHNGLKPLSKALRLIDDGTPSPHSAFATAMVMFLRLAGLPREFRQWSWMDAVSRSTARLVLLVALFNGVFAEDASTPSVDAGKVCRIEFFCHGTDVE